MESIRRSLASRFMRRRKLISFLTYTHTPTLGMKEYSSPYLISEVGSIRWRRYLSLGQEEQGWLCYLEVVMDSIKITM